jgi:uncharacterized protein (DUF2141 family)
MKLNHLLHGLLFPLLSASSTFASPQATGTLSVELSGLMSDKGTAIVKLFVQGDEVPKGRAFRQLSAPIKGGRTAVHFADIPYGAYALFAFHDENENGTLDHGLLGIPKEAIGFSRGFRATIWSGIPNFDDLRFEFTRRQRVQAIPMK